MRKLGAELLDKLRTFRPRTDEAHLASENIEELRQLVERPGANETADARAARIVFLRPHRAGRVLSADAHRTKLEDLERFSIEAHPHLSIENRSAIFDPDEQRDQQHQRREDDRRGDADDEIERALDETAPALERRLGEIDRWQPVDVFDTRSQNHELQEIGDDVDRDDAAHEAI